jgi:Smg protein
MFDILVYIFETYAQPDTFPGTRALARKLTAVGFEQEEISAALEWLSGLEGEGVAHHEPRQVQLAGSAALRVYTAREQLRLPTECRGFLSFLENVGAIDGRLRETIIERALALRDTTVPLGKLKIVALIVLWRRHPAIETIDPLLLEELLWDHEEAPVVH